MDPGVRPAELTIERPDLSSDKNIQSLLKDCRKMGTFYIAPVKLELLILNLE